MASCAFGKWDWNYFLINCLKIHIDFHYLNFLKIGPNYYHSFLVFHIFIVRKVAVCLANDGVLETLSVGCSCGRVVLVCPWGDLGHSCSHCQRFSWVTWIVVLYLMSFQCFLVIFWNFLPTSSGKVKKATSIKTYRMMSASLEENPRNNRVALLRNVAWWMVLVVQKVILYGKF